MLCCGDAKHSDLNHTHAFVLCMQAADTADELRQDEIQDARDREIILDMMATCIYLESKLSCGLEMEEVCNPDSQTLLQYEQDRQNNNAIYESVPTYFLPAYLSPQFESLSEVRSQS